MNLLSKDQVPQKIKTIALSTWIAVLVPILTTVGAAYAYVENKFETKEHVIMVTEDIQWTLAMGDLSVEQSLLQLRMDVIEERMYREEKRSNPDQEKIRRWDKQLNRIERRYQLIDEKMLELNQ